MPEQRSRKEQRLSEALYSYVRDKYEIAKSAAADHDADLQECLALLRGDEAKTVTDPDSLDLNIVAPIVQGVTAMMQDILGTTTDKPYVLETTPVPDLPESVQQQLIDAVQENLPGLIQAAGGDQSRVADAVDSLRRTLLQAENSRADEAASSMERVIEDRMVDADWTSNFLDFLTNFVCYPFAVMKAPVSVIKKMKRWDGGRLRFHDEEVQCIENLSPFDFLPAPNSRDAQNAEFVCERRRLTASQLIDLGGVAGYETEAIDRVLHQYPDGYSEEYSDGNPEEPDTDGDVDPESFDNKGVFDAIGFYGRISGRYLQEYGVEVEDERDWYESEIWVVGEDVILAQLNPNPQNLRPFYTASMYPTPGSIYGSCIPLRISDIQRMCTSSARALARNMAFASGPIGEVNPDQVTDDEDPRVVMPNQMRLVRGTANGANVYKFHKIDSNAQELMGVFDKFLSLAYETIGIPRVAFGSTQDVGSAGRTSGGMSMLMNQAAKPIKLAMREVERNVIEPVVQSFVDDELMYGDDPVVKGDIKVRAQGISGIQEKEQHTERLTWALQSLASMPEGVVTPEALNRLLYYIFEAYGIPTKGILPDFGMQDAVANDLGQMGAGNANGQPGQATDRASLDGRSPDAQAAIQQSNGGPSGPSGGTPDTPGGQ